MDEVNEDIMLVDHFRSYVAAERHITSRSAGDRSVLAIAKVAVAKARQDLPEG